MQQLLRFHDFCRNLFQDRNGRDSMTKYEIQTILKFLEGIRAAGLEGLGIEARDPVWMMSLGLLGRHYNNQRTTISALAETSGAPYATALRVIDRMIAGDLLARVPSETAPRLVYIEPTQRLLHNFHEYCLHLKGQIGGIFGLSQAAAEEFRFGSAGLAATILDRPRRLRTPLDMDGPLRLLLKDEVPFMTLSRMAPKVSEFLGVPVEIELLTYEDLNDAVIANSRLPRSRHDLIALDLPWLGRMALESALEPLDGDLRDSRLNPFDFFAAAWESGRCMGRQLGIPFSPAAEMFLYRRDLFDAAGLPPPRRPEEVLEAARVLHRPQAGRYGIA